MNTAQLQCVVDCDIYMKNRVLGVYSADQIPSHLPCGRGIIVNTDPAYLCGRHWVAFCLNQNNELQCFDSYGKSPATYSVHLRLFMLLFSKIVKPFQQLQGSNSNVCGQYCLLYLMCRCRGFSMKEVYHLFCNKTHINDEFVYNLIKKEFECCLYVSNHGQCCVSSK